MPENRLILSHISSISFSSSVGVGRDGSEQQQVCPLTPKLAVGESGMTQAAEFHGSPENASPLLLCCKILHCLYQGHTSHDYCQPMMGYKTNTKGGLFLGDVGPLTSSFGLTLKLYWIAQPAFCLSFLYYCIDCSPASSDLAPIFSQAFLACLIWPWNLSCRT